MALRLAHQLKLGVADGVNRAEHELDDVFCHDRGAVAAHQNEPVRPERTRQRGAFLRLEHQHLEKSVQCMGYGVPLACRQPARPCAPRRNRHRDTRAALRAPDRPRRLGDLARSRTEQELYRGMNSFHTAPELLVHARDRLKDLLAEID